MSLLRMNAQRRGIILRFVKRGALETKYRAAAFVLREPTWTRKTAYGSGGDGRKLHGSPQLKICSWLYMRREMKHKIGRME